MEKRRGKLKVMKYKDLGRIAILMELEVVGEGLKLLEVLGRVMLLFAK